MADLLAPIHLSRINAASGAASEALDRLCSFWVNHAPRFGAVAAHFPKSLRKRRFVASFWAPEVLLFGGYYLAGFTLWQIDRMCARLVDGRVRPGGETPEGTFWSAELPEIRVLPPIPGDHLLSRLPVQGEIYYRGPRGWHYIAAF